MISPRASALRLRRAGFAVVMTELDRPTVLRRRVAFAEAMYEARVVVEGVEAVRVEEASDIGPCSTPARSR